MIFHVHINTDDSAYDGDNIAHELKENLRDVATALLSGSMEGKIKDCNGNTVGSYWFTR